MEEGGGVQPMVFASTTVWGSPVRSLRGKDEGLHLVCELPGQKPHPSHPALPPPSSSQGPSNTGTAVRRGQCQGLLYSQSLVEGRVDRLSLESR